MDANVLEALDRSSGAFKRAALSNIIIYGRIRCLINKPDILGDGIKETNGYFAIIDAYALKCLGEDYFRESSSSYAVNSVYFTKGSILIYISDGSLVGQDVKVFGKSKFIGATIRRQDSSRRDVGITALVFGSPDKDGKKMIFPLIPNTIVKLSDKDPDARGTALEDFIVLLGSKKGEIPYPETLDSIIPYTGVDVYSEIRAEGIIDSLNTSKVENKKKEVIEYKADKDAYKSSDTGRIDISKIDMHLTFHLDGQPRSEFFEPFKQDIVDKAEAREKFKSDEIKLLSDLMHDSPLDDLDLLNQAFVYRVVSNLDKRLGGFSSIKCKNYVDAFLNACTEGLCVPESKLSSTKINKSTVGSPKEGVEKLKKAVIIDPKVLLESHDPEEDVDLASVVVLGHTASFAVNVVGTCTGIGYTTLKDCMSYCYTRMGMSEMLWTYALFKVPYMLGIVGIGLTLVDCDILYNSIGKVFGADELEINDRYRSYLVHLDTLNNCSNGKYSNSDRSNDGINTFVNKGNYKNAELAYPIKNAGYLKNSGFMAKPDIKDLLELLLEEDLTLSRKERDSLVGKNWYSEEKFEELCDCGIINTLEGYCALERNIESEFLIYEVFEKMGKMPTGITDSTIEDVISDFEADRGFKLEGLQREGIKLCKYRAGVLSGCAGSGKTTTSDCMTEVLKTLGEDTKIVYCTPTGKACRRLAEVVHSTVRTIHSQFGVGMGGSSYIQSTYKRKKKSENEADTVIYILDEMAMCNTNLMYNIAKNVTDNDMIYFLGDVKQLPPIGGGCPFKILMKILPCVELGVSKRAAEGSLVNYNTSLINFISDNYCQELMYDGETFIAKDCPDSSIVSEVKNAFLGFIDGSINGVRYSEDDIQVISGYQSKSKLSSTQRLNVPIQEALRENDRVLYYKETRDVSVANTPFYQNDRVIYVNKNSYDICRYAYEGGVFKKLLTFGCVNGEMGKLVAVIPCKSANIINETNYSKANTGFYDKISSEEFDMIKERYDEKEEKLRKDEEYKLEGYYFVVIKVYDSDLRRDVYLLLRGRSRSMSSTGVCLSGSDLDNLALAYALTCHKMQGSQSKVVIMALEAGGSPMFMNRNMLNTIITRSQGIVCCVGSILGDESMLNRGRKCVSKTDSRDILSVMSGDISWVV